MNSIFHMKICGTFIIYGLNIDCGCLLVPPQWGCSKKHPQSMSIVKLRELMYTPANPTFSHIKWHLRGCSHNVWIWFHLSTCCIYYSYCTQHGKEGINKACRLAIIFQSCWNVFAESVGFLPNLEWRTNISLNISYLATTGKQLMSMEQLMTLTPLMCSKSSLISNSTA